MDPKLASSVLAALRLAQDQVKEAHSREGALLARIRQLERETDKQQDALEGRFNLSARSTAFRGVGLGGKSSVETYRNANVGVFIQLVNELGMNARIAGREAMMFAVRSALLADLEAIYSTPPKTPEEATRRDLLRVVFSARALAWALVGTEHHHEMFRQDVISLFLNSGVDTSVWDFVRRGVERPEQD
jgi:hypothetical protein